MKLELKSIGYWSLIKISFVINFCMGLVIGLIYAVFIGFFMAIAENIGSEFAPGGFGSEGLPAMGILVIILPIMFGFFSGVFNTIIMLIAAFVYNIIAGAFGGLELEFAEILPAAIPQYNQAYGAQFAPEQQPQAAPPPPAHEQRPSSPPPAPPKPQTPPPPPPPVEPYPGENRFQENDNANKPDNNQNPNP